MADEDLRAGVIYRIPKKEFESVIMVCFKIDSQVYPNEITSKVYAHEVVIRLSDGRVQYFSNRIIPSKDNSNPTWSVPRLTADEWEEVQKVF